MSLEIRPLRKRDFGKAIQFAITGMHFNRYTKSRTILNLYGRYFWYDELERASQVIAAYEGDQLVGVLLSDMKGEKKAYRSFWRRQYVRFINVLQQIFYKDGVEPYEAANKEMFINFSRKHQPDGEINFLAADPEAAERGIGTALLHELERREKGKQFDMPVYFDMEEKNQLEAGRDFCSGLIRTFCSEIEKAGYFAGFYTSASYTKTLVSPEILSRYTFWCAQWAKSCSYQGRCGIWQYSSKGSVPGISEDVDLDRCYQDFPKVIRNGGFNGYPKSAGGAAAAPASRKSVEELAREVIAGKWGNGRERQQRLTAAGYDYRVVQRKVNELMGYQGIYP